MLSSGACVSEAECVGGLGKYLVEGPVKRCVTYGECVATGLYYADRTNKRCISEETCKEFRYTYEGDERLCLTANQCDSYKDYRTNEDFHICVNISACQEYELANGTCVSGLRCKQDHQGYMYNDSFPKKCLTLAQCTSLNKYYVDNTDGKCVQRATCATYGLVFEDGNSRECLKSEELCLAKDGYHAERNTGSCVRE